MTQQPGSPTFKNIAEITQEGAAKHGDKIAYKFIVDLEGNVAQLTYRELDRRARATAAILQGLGAAGDRAILLFPPGIDYIVALYACFYAGILAIPAYPPDPARFNRTIPRLKAILKDSTPKLAITTALALSMAEHIMEGDDELSSLRWVATDTVDDGAAHSFVAPEPATWDQIAVLQYTSGSTRQPRGVMLSHGNLLSNLEVMRRAFCATHLDRIGNWLPPYHDMGLIGAILLPAYLGAEGILASPLHFMQRPFLWLDMISRHRITMACGPNFGYELCTRKVTPAQLATLDLSELELLVVSAEPIRVKTLADFVDTFKPYGFDGRALFPAYGLAEATLILTGKLRMAGYRVYSFSKSAYEDKRVIPVPSDATDDRLDLVSSGSAFGGVELIIVNPETRAVCAEREIGEIWVAGSSVAHGYWGRTEETREVFHAEVAAGSPSHAGKRFLRTGDLGFLHEGELLVAGRIKDLIIIRGHNYYPQDIEATMDACHPRIRRGCCAAFHVERDAGGQPSSGGERLVVIAEIAKGVAGDPENEQILRAIQRSVTEENEIRIDEIVLLESGTIYKTSSGKIQRSACRAAFLEGTLSEVARASS